MSSNSYKAMDEFMERWNPLEHGYAWDDGKPTYYRHNPAKYGQATVKPLKRK